jgi:hypothetical protein
MAATFSIPVEAIYKNQNTTVPEWFTPTNLNVAVGEVTEDLRGVRVHFVLYDNSPFNDAFTNLVRTMDGEMKITMEQAASLFDDQGNYVVPVINAILQPLNLQYKAK